MVPILLHNSVVVWNYWRNVLGSHHRSSGQIRNHQYIKECVGNRSFLHQVLTGIVWDLFFFFFLLAIFLVLPSAASTPCQTAMALPQSPDISAAWEITQTSAAPICGGLAPRLGVPEVLFICLFSHHWLLARSRGGQATGPCPASARDLC